MAEKKISLTEEELNELLLQKIAEMKAEETPKQVIRNRTGAETTEFLEERVMRHYFYDGNKYKDDIHAIVNGYNYVIPRGVDVMIPRYVADMIDASEKQAIKASALSDKYEREFLARAKEF